MFPGRGMQREQQTHLVILTSNQTVLRLPGKWATTSDPQSQPFPRGRRENTQLDFAKRQRSQAQNGDLRARTENLPKLAVGS